MIRLNTALLVLTVAASGATPGASSEEAEPSAELLEFLGDWGPNETRMIDQVRPPAQKSPPREKPKDVDHANDEVPEPRSGPRT